MLLAIEQRLKGWKDVNDEPLFPVVGSAMTVAAVFDSGLRQAVELYVVPLDSTFSKASNDLGPISQQGMEGFAVAVGIKTYNDARGASGNAKIDSLKKEVLRCLIGYSPADNMERIELVGTQPLGVKKDNFWFLCRFRVPAWLQQE